MRILGLDIGTVRIGVALSDEMGWTAQPHSVIKHEDLNKDMAAIIQLVEEYSVDEIVVGMPQNMDGSRGEMADIAQSYIDMLSNELTIPIVEWDERLSSVAAERVLIEADVRRKKRKDVIDKVAAAYILQGYLDSKSGGLP